MSDEQNEHTEMSALKASLRAVTEERNRLRQEVNTWKESAATWEARDKSLTEQVKKLKTDLKITRSGHDQDLHLTGMGIDSKSGRRAIRREYEDALSNVAEGAEAPTFGDFVNELKEDPFWGRWFSIDKDKPAAPVEKSKPRQKPASNPNAGATQPKTPTGGYHCRELSRLARQARHQGRAAVSGTVEKTRHHQVISY